VASRACVASAIGAVPSLQSPDVVASISVRVHQGKRQVTVRGHLMTTDLRRLERACGPALEYRELPLELRLGDVTDMEEACRFFLASLERRGAVLV
jgi:hypothetical protein